MLKVLESGLLQIWKTRRWPQQTLCGDSLVKATRAITIEDVQSAFYLIAVGIGLATIVMIFEKIKYTIESKRKNPEKLEINLHRYDLKHSTRQHQDFKSTVRINTP